MAEPNYKPNSYARAEREKKEKVITGTAKQKKKNGVEKAVGAFVSEDLGTVRDSVLQDVVIPTIKKLISESIKSAIDILFYGQSQTTSSSTIASRVQYNTISTRKSDSRTYQRRRPDYDYGEVVVASRTDRNAILDRLQETIDEFGFASVGDLYEFSGLTPEHTDFKYGWEDIRSATIVRTYGSDGGYLIKMPRCIPL